MPKFLSAGIRGSSRRCGSGFAEQVAGDVEKSEAPTLLRQRLEIRLDENLDGLFAGVDLDTNSLVAKVDLMASSIFPSNNRMRHRGLVSRTGRVSGFGSTTVSFSKVRQMARAPIGVVNERETTTAVR